MKDRQGNSWALGCDDISSNTGVYNGAISYFEKTAKNPVEAVVCLLHLNELMLRKDMVYLDGPIFGPSFFSCPQENVYQLPKI